MIKTYKSVAEFLMAMGTNGKPAKAVYFKEQGKDTMRTYLVVNKGKKIGRDQRKFIRAINPKEAFKRSHYQVATVTHVFDNAYKSKKVE